MKTLLLVLLALIPWSWLAVTNRDLPQFGKYQDDGLFVIAAESLRAGEGYRISSLPGEPFQTKYQPLYPALLALLALLGGGLEAAALLQWMIVTGYLLLAFALARSFGFAPWKCGLMMLMLAINPWLLYWGLLPISDFLFACLVLTAFLLPRNVAMGLIAAAAALTKVAGVLLLPALWGKRWLAVSAPILLAFGAWALWAGLHRSPVDHSVMWYYTDYLAFFLNNGGVAALPQILQTNLVSMVMLVGDSVLHDLSGSMFGRFLAVVLFAAAVSGTRRLVGRTGSYGYPVFCGLLMLLLLAWNFSPNVRLAAPLMPLLAMALWEEGEHVAGLIAQSARSKKSADRVAAHLFRAGLLAGIVAAAALNVQFIFQGLPQLLAADRAASEREQRVFAWSKQFLPASAVVMANNDTRFFLATRRRAVRAVPDSVAFYRNDEAAKLKVITEFDAFQRAFGITHILLTPADFGDFEDPQRKEIVRRLTSNPRHHEVFRDGDYAVLEIEPVVASAVSGR